MQPGAAVDSDRMRDRPALLKGAAPVPVVAPATAGHGTLHTLAASAIIIAGLYFARDVLVPFALAALLTFLLAPLVLRLRRSGLGRVPAVITVACLSFAAIGAAGWAVSMQLLDLAQGLPQYEETIRQKIQGFQGPGSGLLTRTGEMFQHLRDDLAPTTDPDATPGAGRTPIPVEIRAPEPTSLDLLRSVAGSLLGPLATAGVVIVLVIFMLIQREDLRDRFFGLVGTGNLHVTTEAMDDAAVRISRYLLMQLLVNLTYGIPVGVGLYFIGVPNPLLWGVLATLLRFVPYIGPLLAMAMPLALAFAVDPGWSVLLMTVGLFVVLELFSNNVVEPWLYGASTGISPVAIMMAAIFWTSLWGPVGLLLSTPLTVCLVVFGRHFPQLQFLSTMLGTESALPVEARFYQRLLAGDVEDAAEIAEEFRAEGGLVRVYDQLLLPALTLLEHDRHRGALDEERKKFVLAHARELADDLEEREGVLPIPGGSSADRPRVTLFPARDEADELSASMLRHLLSRRGIAASVVPSTSMLGDRLESLRKEPAEVVCVCAVPPAAVTHAAYTCRRLRRRFPDIPIVVGVYSAQADAHKLRSHLPADFADEIVTSLEEAAAWVEARVAGSAAAEWVPAAIPPDEHERLAELARFGLLDTPPEEAFDRVTQELARIFGAPISLMSLIDGDRQVWKSQFGLPADLAAAGASDRESSMCGHVVAESDVLVVSDTRADPRFAANPFLQRGGIRFYAGAPLRTRSGSAIGSLCVIDTKPREITERERELLRMVADAVMTEMELRAASRGLSEVSQKLIDEKRSLQGELHEAKAGGAAARSAPAPAAD